MIPQWFYFLFITQLVLSEYCGNNKIPYGFEVHKSGQLTLLCARPNCHEKKYAECPERAEAMSCPENTTWVGGMERRVDGSITLMCCDYDLMKQYGEVIYKNVALRRGEYFEAEEKLDKNGDVIAFDLISNIQRKIDSKGELFSVTVTRFHCGRIPHMAPDWILEKLWPYWNNKKN